MSFKKAPTESVDFELPPGGTYLGTFLGLIDLGTQEWEWNGKKQSSHKIYFLWELNERNANDDNFIVGADYTFSLNEKANLRKMIEGYSGKPLDPSKEIDISVLVGKPCIVSVAEGITSGGKKFVEVTGIARLMKGQVAHSPSRETFLFDIDTHPDFSVDPPIPDWVPPLYGRNVAEEIKKSPEWKQGAALGIPASSPASSTMTGPVRQPAKNGIPPVAAHAPAAVGAASTMDEDSPF